MLKKIIFFILFFFIPLTAQSKNNSEIIKKFTEKFETINNIKFDFIQTSNDSSETGTCFLSYPKKLICRYEGDEKKEIIIKDNTLAIIKRKYQRVYYYQVSDSPFSTILDKEKIIAQITNIKNVSSQDGKLFFEFNNENSTSSLQLFLNKDTLDIVGWKTTGYDQQTIVFTIKNSQINTDIIEKFKIPEFNLFGNGN
jgi:outer membrane lipoprotein-sorting protein